MDRRPLDEYANGALRCKSQIPGPEEAARHSAMAWAWWQLYQQEWYNSQVILGRQTGWAEAWAEAVAAAAAATP